MFACLDNILDTAVLQNKILLSLDLNDPFCNNSQIREKLESTYPLVEVKWGYSKNKIDAFNRDVPKTGWDIIVCTSDDIRFKKGFDLQIDSDVQEAGWKFTQNPELENPRMDPGIFDCTVWYGDGAPHGKIMTVPIMTRKYYERLGYIYNPQYQSLFCDEEAIYVGEKLGKIFYSSADILEHLHPAWGKAAMDPQYQYTQSFYSKDKAVFDQRKAMNFPL